MLCHTSDADVIYVLHVCVSVTLHSDEAIGSLISKKAECEYYYALITFLRMTWWE